MSKRKKTNPRKKIVTQSDVNKAKNKAVNDAIQYALTIFIYVMWDKEGYGKKRIDRVWNDIKFQSECVAEGLLSVDDMIKVMEEEAGIILR